MAKDIKKPKVTVLMSVYNSEKYLRVAIDSILNQTYEDFEFLIINDGSKDDSLNIIKSYNDKRIRLISRKNKGLVASLNEGIVKANGEYIARQDSDDASTPNRLAKEVEFLDSNPDIGLVGSNYIVMDSISWKALAETTVFTNPKDLKLAQITCNQYGHGSIMMRKDVAIRCKGYDPKVGYVEDYDLWNRISRITKIANIEESLYLYRKNEEGISQSNLETQIKQTFAVRDKSFKHFMKNKSQYSILNYSPSGKDYNVRKSILYRDLAYLYIKYNKKINALFMLGFAFVYNHKSANNIKLFKAMFDKDSFNNWNYEFL